MSEEGATVQVLDHGYVSLIETWGSEERIIEAARMSTGKGFKGWGPVHSDSCDARHPSLVGLPGSSSFPCTCEPQPGDERLLAYLYRNHHMTPFEMAGATFEVQAPIFVFREWHRHRTQSYNELSARYTPLPDVNYVPSVHRIRTFDQRNKQAANMGTRLENQGAEWFQEALQHIYLASQQVYTAALDSGIPKELARLVIPVGRYSRMRASANLRNWLQFLTLRCDEHAQWEVRQYANAVAEVLAAKFPRTVELWRGEK